LAIVAAGVYYTEERQKKVFVDFDCAPGCATHGEWGEKYILIERLLELEVTGRGIANER
jgi:hypothetical protein